MIQIPNNPLVKEYSGLFICHLKFVIYLIISILLFDISQYVRDGRYSGLLNAGTPVTSVIP
jgi:hypothetical protein